MIVIDKLISPYTPVEQVEPLLRDLMESVYHPEMKSLAQKIVDPELNISERRKLKEQFRNFDHGGANDYSEVNYKELIDKLLDPNLPDLEYKPTMKALLDGDLDQDKKNMVSAIISCQNKDQKAKMVKRFKSLFDREKEEKEKAERERLEAKAAKERAKAELEANLLTFDDDGMTLIYKFLDKNIPREKKTEIYERLMEPDIDAEIKNLAIQIVNSTKAAERPKLIEDFKKRREEEKIAAVKRKEEEARRKVEEEKEMKDLKMQRKKQLLDQKKKSEMMKRRDLMLKYRAEDRKRESQFGVVGPSSVVDRDEWRRNEREKMKAEISKFREEARLKMMRQEREDRLKQGWMVTTFNSSYNINIKVQVPDLASSLAPPHQLQFQAALSALKSSDGDLGKSETEKPKENVKSQETITETPTENAQDLDKKTDQKVNDKVDAEFEKYFQIFVDPTLTEEAETTHVKQLIKDKKSALVRSLAIKLASIPGAGKSKVFQTLIKKFCPDKVNSNNQPDPNVQKQKPQEEINEGPSKSGEGPSVSGDGPSISGEGPSKSGEGPSKSGDGPSISGDGPSISGDGPSISGEGSSISGEGSSISGEGPSKSGEGPSKSVLTREKIEEMKTGGEAVQDNGIENKPKRRLSEDSNKGNESKKLKMINVFEENKENKGEERNSSDKKKKKKHKHKHKDERDKKEDRKDEEMGSDENGDKKKKKHKNKEKNKKKDKDKDKVKSASVDKKRSSTESRSSKSDKDEGKPLLEMSMIEIKKKYNLKNFNGRVRIKNCRKLCRIIQKKDVERDKRWEENGAHGSRSRSVSKERKSSSRPVSRSKSRPHSSASNKSIKSRSPSRSNAVRSRSPTRSRSNSIRSRSPVRTRSPTRSITRSNSGMSRSPVRSRTNSSSSRSPYKSRSTSKSPLRSPSVSSRSRSNSP